MLDKRQQVEEARQVLEQRLAELREAEATAVAENERLDAELVREGKAEVRAGDVAPIDGDVDDRAEASLRRAADDLRDRDRRP